jgi:histidyl-tRNA synthetase
MALSPGLQLKNKPEFSLMIEKIWSEARNNNYNITYTPLMESPDILARGGKEVEGLTFRVMKRGDKLSDAIAKGTELYDAVLRYDQTIGLANFMRDQGLYNLRRCQVGPVWRAERNQAGRYREFWQADFDIVGKGAIEGNAKIANMFMDLLRSWLPELNLSLEVNLVNSDNVTELGDFLRDTKGFLNSELARGQDYYQGVVWEIKVEGHSLSVGGGGCYTILDRRAAGGSLGLERILMLMP